MQVPASTANNILDRRQKRRHHGSDRRYNKRVKVDMFINRFLNGQPYMCRMVDISRTGIRLAPMIEPDGSLAPQYMGLQFQLPDRNDVLTASGMTIPRDRGSDGRSPPEPARWDSPRPFTSSFGAPPRATGSLALATNTQCFGGVRLTVANGVSMVRASVVAVSTLFFSTATPFPEQT